MKKDMQKHARIVSIILMVLGSLYLLVAVLLILIGLVATNNQMQTGDIALLPAIFTGGTILLPLVLVGVLHIVTAKAFRAGKGWSRIALWILSVLNLGNVPLGTGIAIYTMWVLFNTRRDVAAISD